MILWFMGLSGAGKSTLCSLLETELLKLGKQVLRLDGDAVREERKTQDQFTRESIHENNVNVIQRCVESRDHHDFILVSLISPLEATRRIAREKLGDEYVEIYVKCALPTLVERDTKGLYKKAIQGEIKNLIGYSKELPFEEPERPSLTISSGEQLPSESLAQILRYLKSRSLI